MAKMIGKQHEPHCDCNIEQWVSGAGEKCNHRYGNKRQRAKEKREWKKWGLMYEPTDDEADAAQVAFHNYAHGWDEPPLTRRELGFTRMGWKAALKAAHESRDKNAKRKGW